MAFNSLRNSFQFNGASVTNGKGAELLGVYTQKFSVHPAKNGKANLI